MTISAPLTDAERAERTERAWSEYRKSLRDLEGREYEDAEHVAWDLLQRELADLEQPSDGLVTT